MAKVDDASGSDAADTESGATGDLSMHLERGLTLDGCRTMTPAAAMARWKKYIERLTNVLVEAEMPRASDECQKSLREVRPCPPRTSLHEVA